MAQGANILAFIACALISIISLVNGAAILEQPSDNVTIDFKALFDKFLDDIPVVWLVSHGIMADLAVDQGLTLQSSFPTAMMPTAKGKRKKA